MALTFNGKKLVVTGDVLDRRAKEEARAAKRLAKQEAKDARERDAKFWEDRIAAERLAAQQAFDLLQQKLEPDIFNRFTQLYSETNSFDDVMFDYLYPNDSEGDDAP